MIVGMGRPSGGLAELASGSVAVCHGTVADWAPRPDDGVDWLGLLGQDAPRYLAMRPGGNRARFAAARRLLKYVCAVRLGVEPTAVALGYEPRGRPYLEGAGMPHVSISHTRDLVAVAVSDVGPVGVDVEHGERPLLDEALLARTCTPRERADLRSVPAGGRNRHAVALWTLKESYAKALGRGLAVDFRKIGFSLHPRTPGVCAQPRLQMVREPAAPAGAWRFQLAAVPGGYASACAVLDSFDAQPLMTAHLTTAYLTTAHLTTAYLTRSTA